MADELQINGLKRTIGVLTASLGLKQIINASSEFSTTNGNWSKLNEALKKSNLQIPLDNLDSDYYFTSWENWEKIIDVLWGIMKNFNWVAEKFDCDQRSAFTTSLAGLLFGLNTCCGVFCEVYDANTGILKYLHWANIIIDKDNNCYLFDVDYGGMKQKITGNNMVMGANKYKFIRLRAY